MTVHLPAKDVEQVGGARHVSDLHIAILVLAFEFIWAGEYSWVLIAELKVSLHSARGVFWTLSIIAMRKRHNETRSLKPFDLPGTNELIDYALTVIGEVTKLSFPNN